MQHKFGHSLQPIRSTPIRVPLVFFFCFFLVAMEDDNEGPLLHAHLSPGRKTVTLGFSESDEDDNEMEHPPPPAAVAPPFRVNIF